MKRLVPGAILLATALAASAPAGAEVGISIGITLPPAVVFAAPPDVVVVPDTDDVYVIPDADVDIFFWGGWWWRPWEGRWYRSRRYDRGWVYYRSVPSFYFDVDPGWRPYFRDRDWHGHRWNYERIPNRRLQQNWQGWHESRHWRRRGTWGVEGYRPHAQDRRRELRLERQEQYRQRPEVQRYQQERKDRERQVRERPEQPRARQPQRPQRGPQVERHGDQPQSRPQGSQPRGRGRQGEPERPSRERPERAGPDSR